MEFNLQKSLEVWRNTPDVLDTLLYSVDKEWYENNEGGNSWSPFHIVAHLIVGEKTDWLMRVEIILSDKTDKRFPPFNMEIHIEEAKGKTMAQLLGTFKMLRANNLRKLEAMKLTQADLDKTGIHPEFGRVTLKQHLATWTVHDLGHIAQITRVMSKQYKTEVGPWMEYLPILTR